MRRLLDVIILSAVIGGGAYLAYTHPAQVRHLMRLAQDTVAPCSSPRTYSLIAVDPRFDISTSTVLSNLKQAEEIWEEPSGKDLFEYKPEGGEVSVALVYDERQQATDKLSSLGIRIDESKATYDSLRAKYDDLSIEVEQDKATYERSVAAYEEREAAYNAEVRKWNREGGAPPAEYAKLNAEKVALEDDLRDIRAMESRLNRDIDTLNALATRLNQLIVQLNLNVDQYNQTGARSGEFEEGLYEVKSGIATITIYEFASDAKLIRVLAHEFGHALGMDHVGDAAAIMYKINKGTSLTATDADAAELNRVCRLK
ncbi:hypothetical protein C4568_02760 [Candidatus Parcubacteria bacterium]|nr:MAG: hypothetical protein C4568_02760 [Candidatus Parcubacteria bacterium]